MQVCYYVKKIESNSYNGNKAVLLCVVDNSTGKFYGTTELLNDPDILKSLNAQGIGLSVAALPGLQVPVITVNAEVLGNTDTYLNCDRFKTLLTGVMEKENVTKLPNETYTMLYQKILPAFDNNKLLTSTLLSSITCQYNWERRTELKAIIRVNVSQYDQDFLGATRDLLNSLSADLTAAFTAEELIQNSTLMQKLCTDEFYIGIPAREEFFLLSNEEDDMIDASMLIPPRSSVCDPYGGNLVDESPNYEQEIKQNNLVAQPLRLKRIQGDPLNNGLEIQDNEIRYYNSLVKWIKFNIGEYYGDANVDTIDSLSLEYVQALLRELYMWHWKHNANVPVEYNPKNGNTDTIDSCYSFKKYPGYSDSRTNAILLLFDFLEAASADLGWKIYPQAIIQLGRWGERKPTCIQFEDYKYVFELGNNTVHEKTKSLADYSKCSINGKQTALDAIVYEDAKIADYNIGFDKWEMPVGVVLRKEYMNSETDDKITTTVAYSFIDLITEMINNNLTVDGIKTDGSRWQVDAISKTVTVSEILKSVENTEGMLEFPIFRSSGLTDLYFDLNTNFNANRETQFSLMHTKQAFSGILKSIDEADFSDYSEFIEKRSLIGNKKSIIDYMIVRDLLKVYHEVASNYQKSMTMDNVFVLWHKAILKTGYVSESGFYKEGKNKATPLPGADLSNFSNCFWRTPKQTQPSSAATMNPMEQTAENIRKIAAFETTNTENRTSAPTSATVQTKQGGDLMNSIGLIMSPADCTTYCKVMDGDNVVFLCAVDKFTKKNRQGVDQVYTRYILLKQDALNSVDLDSVQLAINIDKVFAYVCHTLFSVANANLSTAQLFFDSKDTIKQLRDYANKRR